MRDTRASLASLLLLADGRFPVGGHAHSGGIEAAMLDGRVRTVDDVEAFTMGRLQTSGLNDAALAAATLARLGQPGDPNIVLRSVDAEADARLPAPPMRDASRRRLGRQLARVAGACWPDPVLALLDSVHPDGAHQPVVLGAVGAAAGLTAWDVAGLALHHVATTPTQAAVKLAGFDPFQMAAVQARLATIADGLANDAAPRAGDPLPTLPCTTGPIIDIAAIAHDARPSRLFAT